MVPLFLVALVSDATVGPQMPSARAPVDYPQCPPAENGEIVVCKSPPARPAPTYGPSTSPPDKLPGYALGIEPLESRRHMLPIACWRGNDIDMKGEDERLLHQKLAESGPTPPEPAAAGTAPHDR